MTTTLTHKPDSFASLRLPEFRYWLVATMFTTLANRGLVVALGYQIYELSRSPLALGILGLVEALPALGLTLFGGHLADRYDRRAIVLTGNAVAILAAFCFALSSLNVQLLGLVALYAIVFVMGVARGFADPALSAFEAQVVPRELYVNAATWAGSVSEVVAIVGPALGGLTYAWFGATTTYSLVTVLLCGAWCCMALIKRKPMPEPESHESIWQSIAVGVRYVWRTEALIGSMALDLFAVLFGGVMALLPIFASDILQVGPIGLGWLVAAPSVGALLSMLWATRYPPTKRAGPLLLIFVAGFGLSIIVFGLSTNFWLSLFALVMSGMCDGVSMVIRDAIMRLLSPEALRGRIAAVVWIFIGSSNEIGAFESGVAASLLGTVPAVWLGGVVTLIVVGLTAWLSPQLRTLDLTAHTHTQTNLTP